MELIDDPLLALLVRFVAGGRRLDVEDNQEFLRRQLDTVRAYAAQFPDAERNERVMEWIQEHAAQYRRDWQGERIRNCLSGSQCLDCPLLDLDIPAHCDIHGHWLELLSRFLADKISSRAYVEKALSLLSEHKSQLRVGPGAGATGPNEPYSGA